MRNTRIARWTPRVALPAAAAVGLGFLGLAPASATPDPVTVTFGYSPQAQTWTVPDGVTSVEAVLDGAAGGNGANAIGYTSGGGYGGAGGQVWTILRVTPGEVLTVRVGQGGSQGHSLAEGGGGTGGTGGEAGGSGGTPDNFVAGGGGGGGGASAILSGTTVLAVAGGGGGGGGAAAVDRTAGGNGGTALSVVGGTRVAGDGTAGVGLGAGSGGSGGTAGGPAGDHGGNAPAVSFAAGGGGGGGGWPRGGAAGAAGGAGPGSGGGGGAGASGVDPDRSTGSSLDVSPLAASVAADGRVTLTYRPAGVPTVTSVTASPASPVYGQPVTLTLHVSAGGQPLATDGAFIVSDFDTGVLEDCTYGSLLFTDSEGTATCVLARPADGGHDWYARYVSLTGDYRTSVGDVTVHVDRAATTTTLTSVPTSAVAGQPVTLTAIVARAESAGAGLSTDSAGTVTFREGTTVLCQDVAGRSDRPSAFDCPLPGGLQGGGHDLTATWTPAPGYSGFDPSTGSLHQDVSAAATQVALQSSAAGGSDFGAPVTFTATVAPVAPAGGTPTGPLQFVVDGNTYGGPVSLTDGSGTSEPVAGLTPGTHTVTVNYAGDGSYQPSSSAAFQQLVNKGAASVTLTSSAPGGADLGAPVTFTAAVAPVAPASVPATGSVQFAVDGTPYGPPVPLTGGTAGAAPIAGLAPGAHTVTASYSGDGDYSPMMSPALTQQVDVGAQAVTSPRSGGLAVTTPTVVGNATVTGPVTVSGASIALTGATINGPVWINGASAVRICGSTIRGPVVIAGATGPVLIGDGGSRVTGCAGNTFWGPIVIVGSSGGTVFDGNQVHGTVTIADSAVGTEIGGNTITDLLACRGNTPPPANGGRPNTVKGPRLGQCAVRGF